MNVAVLLYCRQMQPAEMTPEPGRPAGYDAGSRFIISQQAARAEKRRAEERAASNEANNRPPDPEPGYGERQRQTFSDDAAENMQALQQQDRINRQKQAGEQEQVTAKKVSREKVLSNIGFISDLVGGTSSLSFADGGTTGILNLLANYVIFIINFLRKVSGDEAVGSAGHDTFGIAKMIIKGSVALLTVIFTLVIMICLALMGLAIISGISDPLGTLMGIGKILLGI